MLNVSEISILAAFLRENKAEAIAVSIFEYDAEKEMRLFRKAEREVGREEGREIGREEGREEGLAILISTLKNLSQPLDTVYHTVTSHAIYQNITLETVKRIYNSLN